MKGFAVHQSVLAGMSFTDDTPVIGEWWSGYAFETSEGRWALVWRGQGDTGATLIEFKNVDMLNQYCDGLEGDTDEFVRN